jgi:hypothetical protein
MYEWEAAFTVDQQIIKADKHYRTKLFTAYAIGLVAISAGIGFGVPSFLKYLDSLEIPAMLNVGEITIISLLTCFIGPSAYLIIVGNRIIRSRRIPYPGQKVIRDTKVIEGKKAVFRGRLLFFFGIAAIIFLAAGAARSHYFFEKFRHFNPFETINRLV